MAFSSDSQIDKAQHGCPKRVQLLDVNINTGESINTERASKGLIFSGKTKNSKRKDIFHTGKSLLKCYIFQTPADCMI